MGNEEIRNWLGTTGLEDQPGLTAPELLCVTSLYRFTFVWHIIFISSCDAFCHAGVTSVQDLY
jgi:hypothetical protein